MSIKLMSAIFDTEMIDLPCTRRVEHKNGTVEFVDYTAKASTAKFVLLAIADHANDYGQGAYPGLAKLKKKTALSKQGIIDTIEALRANGLLSIAETPSMLGTNDYTINIRCFPKMAEEAAELPDVVKPLDQGGKATLPDVVKPLDHNHKLNEQEPLSAEKISKIKQSAYKAVDAILETERKSAGKTWTNLPEPYHAYGRAFCESTGLNYHKKYLFDWINTFDEWQADGFQPADVRRAVEACRGKTDISRPGSITFKLRAQRAAFSVTESQVLIPAALTEDTSKFVPPPAHLRAKAHAATTA